MLEDKLKEYGETFGEAFPMIPLSWGRTDGETIALIDKCLNVGKTAYDLGLVTDGDDLAY